jgi:hypothetical protein
MASAPLPEPEPESPPEPEPGVEPVEPAARRHVPRLQGFLLWDFAPLAAFAALAYIPLLLTAPGRVAADTKAYLYLDPGRLLASAASIWDPTVAGGEVTHQNIGYLFPQGPFYWLFATAGVPTWVAQRLWIGTLLFAAGAGVWYLCRVLSVGSGAAFVAGAFYMLSPYPLQYVQRISALVLPWSGLGWMLAFTVLALRKGGWRYPALFAIVVAAVGATNATSLIYVGLAPVLYLPYAVFVAHEVRIRAALAAAGRIALLSLGVSLWWVAALGVEAGYGINVLRFTETVPAIASTSLPSEVLRGLGYWYFYGKDQLGPWLKASVDYESWTFLLAASFALPLAGVVAGVVTRWRLRAFFITLVVVGVALSVGTYPYTRPSALGRVLEDFMTRTTSGFALRSTDRATPVVVLGLAVLAGAGLAAIWRRFRAAGVLASVGVVALAVVNAVPLLSGAAVEAKFTRPEQLPSYVYAAARYLDAQGDSTRVLVEPGEDFAAYDYGTTTDSIWSGVLTRPVIQRQQLIDGSLATADLLSAFDLQLQQDTYEPSTLAPIARLLSAGDVVDESDLAYWWYTTPKPVEMWQQLRVPPPGIGAPVSFGPSVGDSAPPPYQDINDETLALPYGAPRPPALAVFPVSGARPIYRAEPAAAPLVVDGDGSGLVSAAAAGLLAENPTIFYAANLDGDPALAHEVITPGSSLVVTDTNAKVERRWTSVAANVGEIEPAKPGPTSSDATAVPLDVFPHAPASAYTTAVYSGAVYVSASSYGNATTYTPEDRPYEAFDGNNTTAWTAGAFELPVGNWIQIRLQSSHSIDHLNLVQPLGGDPDRWIRRVSLDFGNGHVIRATLGPSSRTAAGQTITFPRLTFTTLRITVTATTHAHGIHNGGSSGVGFAEIRIPGVSVHESVALPTDLLSSLGAASLSHRLTLVMTRLRAPDPPRTDPELTMSRIFQLPTARTFAVAGTARISPLVADNVIDNLLGGPHVFGGAVIGSDARLPGDLDARAIFAFDGNPHTAWMPGFGARHQVGAWMEMALPHPVHFDHLDLRLLDDGMHSVPTALRITTDNGSDVLVRIPAVTDVPVAGHSVLVPVQFPEVSGTVVRFTIAGIRRVNTPDYYSGGPVTLPVGVAELGVPGVHFSPENPAAPLPDVCRPGLLRIDGVPISVRVFGTVGAAETGQGLRFVGCGSAAQGLALGAGTHTLVTSASSGLVGGYDVDRVLLDSAPGGGAMPLSAGEALTPVPGPLASGGSGLGGTAGAGATAPTVQVLSSSATGARLSVSGASGPFWLVLGQSIDSGWHASVSGGPDLGTPVLIDGYANGWYVQPPAGGATFVVNLEFAPQNGVTDAIIASAIALAVCLLLAVWPRRLRPFRRIRTRRRRPRHASSEPEVRQESARIPSLSRHSFEADGPAEPEVGTESAGIPSLSRPTFEAAGHGGSAAAGPRPDIPVLVSVHDRWRRPHPAVVVVATILSGLVAAAVVPPPWDLLAGLAIGGAVLIGLLAPFGRVVTAVGAAGCMLATGLVVVTREVGSKFPNDGTWPQRFAIAGTLAWFAVLALGADGLVEVARRPARRATDETTTGASAGNDEPATGAPRAGKAGDNDSAVSSDGATGQLAGSGDLGGENLESP